MHTAEFRLSITKALGDQLATSLEQLTPGPLDPHTLSTLERRGGVYQLYLHNDLVYIGKADTSLPQRLDQHRRKIDGRLNIDTGDMTFTSLYVDEDLSAVAPETLLINRHRTKGETPWNYNGFGNKDPGRQRDTSTVDPGHFDALYPADMSYPCHQVTAGGYTVSELLARLKTSVPWVFRYQAGTSKPANQPDEYSTTLTVPVDSPPAEDVFTIVIGALPPGWQLTVLPGYAILYREQRAYSSARQTYRR